MGSLDFLHGYFCLTWGHLGWGEFMAFGRTKHSHGLWGSIRELDEFGGKHWTLFYEALTLGPFLDGCSYVGSWHMFP